MHYLPAVMTARRAATRWGSALEGDVVDGTRVFKLRLQTGTVEWIPGAPTATYGANGDLLGPTLHFRRGERVRQPTMP